jgi:hypothetical protein
MPTEKKTPLPLADTVPAVDKPLAGEQPDAAAPVKQYRTVRDVDVIRLQETVDGLSREMLVVKSELKSIDKAMTNGVAFAGFIIVVIVFILYNRNSS